MGLFSIIFFIVIVVVAIILIAVFIPASGKKLARAVKKGATIAIDRLHDRVEKEEKKVRSRPRRMETYDENEVVGDEIDSITEFFKTSRVDAITKVEESEFIFTPPVYYDSGEKKGKLKNIGEQLCRLELERRFHKNFPTALWGGPIRSPVTQHALELDCYNEEMKLALEFNGEQHYIFPSHYIKDRRTFEVQVWNDRFKREECERLGIVLIEVDGRNRKYNEIIDSLHMLLHGKLPHSGDINVWIAANPELFVKLLSTYPARAD